MLRSFSAELLKTRKRAATWLLCAVWLVLALLFAYVFPYLGYVQAGVGPVAASGTPPEQILASILPASMITNSVDGYPLFGGAIVLILGALSTGGEYGWGTLKTALTQRPRRLEVYGGKVAVLAVVVLALVLANLGLAAACSGAIAAAESQPADWPSAADFARGIGAGWLVLMMWGMLGLMLGVLFRGTALAIGLGLVWLLAVENLVRGIAGLLGAFDTLQKGLPGVNAGSIVAALPGGDSADGTGTPGVAAVVGGTQSTLVVAAYLVVFALVAGVVLRRRDVT